MLQNSIEAKQKLLQNKKQLETFNSISEIVINSYEKGGRLYIAGNGGSAADAQHLAAEFVSKLGFDRAALPAEALTTDSSILTAIGNDYGFEQVFARQLEGKATPNDVFLAITTSGNSCNILTALEQAKQMGVVSVLLSGGDGGKAEKLADYSLLAESRITSVIQETHILLAHALCSCVEMSLFSDNKVKAVLC